MRAFFWLFAIACQPQIEDAPTEDVASRRQIASGGFHAIGQDGSRDEGGIVLALRDDDDTLAIYPFAGGDGCLAGPAAGYSNYGIGYRDGWILSDGPTRVAVRDALDETGVGPVRFVDATCADTLPVVAGDLRAAPLRDFEDGSLVVWTTSGELLRADPGAGTSDPIASGVTAFAPGWEAPEGGDPTLVLWTIEDGTLVMRGASGELRLGSGVTEMSIGCPLRYEDNVPFFDGICPTPLAAWVDGAGLHLAGEAEPVATDACAPALFPALFEPGSDGETVLAPVLAYFSPCADRTLVLLDLGTGTTTTHESGVSAVRRLSTGDVVYVLGDGPTPRIGTGLVATPEGSDEIGTAVVLDSVEAYAAAAPDGATATFFLALANFDGSTGDLGLYLPGQPGFAFLEGVAEYESDGFIAALTDFDGEQGTLQVVDVVTGASTAPGAGPPILEAHGVRRGDFRWSHSAFALDYLEDFDPAVGAGRLRTWTVPAILQGGGGAGDDVQGEEGFVVDEGVSEWREIVWPDAGELYVVRGGEREGIWYADWKD